MVVALILLFALFIHKTAPLRYIAFAGLTGAALLTGYLTRQGNFAAAIGLLKPERKTLFYTIPAFFLGILLAVLTRNKYGLALIPETLGGLALLSPLIGMVEELVFRGFIQGHLSPVSRIFSVVYASLAHTGYKLLVISLLPGPFEFDMPFMILWTFIGGTAFGVLKDLSGNSIPPLVAHALFDVMLYGGFSSIPAWVWS
jgi:membrane protease YdiL (CAAX protease family)